MSEELDKRVVELQFDNAQFEKNVKQSTKTIDKLDESLQFKNVSPSLEKVKNSFTALQVVAITAVATISNRIVNLGIQLVKSLSIDNITTGWSKFEQKTMAVATMTAQKIRVAGVELTNYSDKINAINDQLEKLNWFTDETSYNFTDMADNIGKFTAAGRDLDESVNAMMGIANWAALSGQNASTASIAMTQLAQALGRGYIMTMDWRSIENAQMSTEEFKQTVLDTATALGELTKEGEKYITKTGDKISVTDFDLSSKWFTSNILIKSLEKYSAAVERIYQISKETGKTATEVMALYSDELETFGLKAFRAAQEARTFTDAIKAVKDAVSTGWLNTAEKIFGGYDESKVLWTELANQLYDVFAEGGNFRNEILGMWKDLAGRADIFGEHGTPNQGAFWNIYDSIIAVKNLIKETWDSIFSITTFSSYSDQVSDLAEKLKSITARIKEFTKKIKDTIENSFELRAIFSGLFSIFKVVIQLIYGIAYALDPIVQLIKNIVSLLFNRIAAFGASLTKVDGVISAIQKTSRIIADILSNIIEFIDPVGFLDKFFKLISKIYKVIADTHILEKAAQAVKDFINAFRSRTPLDIFEKISSGVMTVKKQLGVKVSPSAEGLLDPIYVVTEGLLSLAKGIIAILKPLIIILGQTMNLVGVVLQNVGDIMTHVINTFNGTEASKFIKGLVIAGVIVAALAVIIYGIYASLSAINAFISPIQYFIRNLSDAIYSIGASFQTKAISNIISSLAQLLLFMAISMAIIANIPTGNFIRASITLGVMLTLLVGMVIILLKMTRAQTELIGAVGQFKNMTIMSKVVGIIRSFSLALIAIALSLKILSGIEDTGKLMVSLGIVISVIGAFIAMIWALNKFTKVDFDYKKATDLFFALSITMFILAMALKKMASIGDVGKLIASAGVLIAIMVTFGLVVKYFAASEKAALRMEIVAKSIGKLAAGMFLYALSLMMFKNIPTESILKAMSTLIISLTFIGMITKYIATTEKATKRMWSVVGALTLMAFAMGMFATSLMLFNFVSVDAIKKGLGVVVVALLMLSAVTSALSASKTTGGQMLLVATSLIVLAAGISSLAIALLLLSLVSWSAMGKGVAIVAGGFLLLGLAAVLLKPVIGVIFLLSSSVLILGLGMITAAIGLGMFSASLVLFAAAIVTNAALIGSALLTLGPLLVTAIIEAFKLLFNSMSELIPSIVNMVTALLNGIVTILNESAGILINAIVGLIAKLLQAISDNSKSIFDSIFKIINALLDALSANIKTIANKLVDILIKIIQVLTARMPEIVKALVDMLTALVNSLFDNLGPFTEVLIKRLFEFLSDVIPMFISELMKFAGIMSKAVLVFIGQIISLTIISLGTLGKLFIDLVGGILLIVVNSFIGLNEVVRQAMRTILYNIFYSLYSLLSDLPDDLSTLMGGALSALLGSVIKMVGLMLKPFLKKIGLGDMAEDIIGAGQDMITKAKTNIDKAILEGSNVTSAMTTARNNISNVISKVTGFISEDTKSGLEAITQSMNDGLAQMGEDGKQSGYDAGQNTSQGTIDGITSKNKEVELAGKESGDAAIEGYKEATKSHSPSKVMEQMGKYFVTGLINGIDGNTSDAKDSVMGLMNEALSGIESVLSSDLDTEFSIRPVMDLSGVSAGAANISSLMSSINGGSVSLSGKLATSVSKNSSKGSVSSGNQNESIVNNAGDTYTPVFNITSNDPQTVAKEVNVLLEKMSVKTRLAKGGVK